MAKPFTAKLRLRLGPHSETVFAAVLTLARCSDCGAACYRAAPRCPELPGLAPSMLLDLAEDREARADAVGRVDPDVPVDVLRHECPRRPAVSGFAPGIAPWLPVEGLIVRVGEPPECAIGRIVDGVPGPPWMVPVRLLDLKLPGPLEMAYCRIRDLTPLSDGTHLFRDAAASREVPS